jgi:hypothetical protein
MLAYIYIDKDRVCVRYEEPENRNMELVYCRPRDSKPNNQDDQWDRTRIGDIPAHGHPLHHCIGILDIVVTEEEHSMEGFHEELDLMRF